MTETAIQQTIFKLPGKILLMYIACALLFMTSVNLHIHTKESAASVDHGYAVAISTLTDELMHSSNDEINVSTDSILKVRQNNLNLQAVLLLIAILVTFQRTIFIGRVHESQQFLPMLSLYATPPLRAPPQ